MRGPGETVDAAMLAPAVRIDADLKSDIRALIARNDGFRGVTKILRTPVRPLGVRSWIFLNDVSIAEIDVKFFESIGWAPGCAASVNCG